MPPLHHGRPDDDGTPGRGGLGGFGRGLGGPGGPGPRLRTAWTFMGVLFTCALIGFWALRLFGYGRGEVGLPVALGILAVAAVAAALITRAVRGR